jgi:hypothetical protein
MLPQLQQDESLTATGIFPDAQPGSLFETSSFTETALDLTGVAAVGQDDFIPDLYSLRLAVPAVTGAQLPDGETLTYSIVTSDSEDFASLHSPVLDGAAVLAADCIVQTGAGVAGAAAATYRHMIQYDCRRYVRAVVTASSGIHDCSGSKMTLRLLRGDR